jgi:putative FmdB family regulatory protein
MLYDYICDECSYEMVDVYQSIKDDALVKCPSCGKDTLRRVIYGGIGSFMSDPKTIGSLADKNWSKKGHYERSDIESQSKKSTGETSYFSSFGSASSKEINKMNEEQKTKYIMTGEK